MDAQRRQRSDRNLITTRISTSHTFVGNASRPRQMSIMKYASFLSPEQQERVNKLKKEFFGELNLENQTVLEFNDIFLDQS